MVVLPKGPRGVCRSSVRPFLLVFSAAKIGDFSHHCCSVTGMPAISRVPSGRRADSTWMTSAPSMAKKWVQQGPAQNVVISNTRSPLNGNRFAGPVGTRRGVREAAR